MSLRDALIDDVTTTPERPPEFRALEREPANAGRDMRYPARFAPLQRSAHPGLRPLLTDLDPSRLFELVQATALENPRWAIASIESARLQLEAVVTARWLRFTDDVVIQVRAGEGGGSSLHMRGKARRGPSDLGRNARTIRAFLEAVEEKLIWAGDGAP